jgi:hypothetical protein
VRAEDIADRHVGSIAPPGEHVTNSRLTVAGVREAHVARAVPRLVVCNAAHTGADQRVKLVAQETSGIGMNIGPHLDIASSLDAVVPVNHSLIEWLDGTP